jgi:hypothetical protein
MRKPHKEMTLWSSEYGWTIILIWNGCDGGSRFQCLKQSYAWYLSHAGVLFGLFFDPQSRGNMSPPKYQLTFNGLQELLITSQKTVISNISVSLHYNMSKIFWHILDHRSLFPWVMVCLLHPCDIVCHKSLKCFKQRNAICCTIVEAW